MRDKASKASKPAKYPIIRIYSIAEVAKMLSCTRQAILRQIALGKIRPDFLSCALYTTREVGSYFFTESGVIRLLQIKSKKAKIDLHQVFGVKENSD